MTICLETELLDGADPCVTTADIARIMDAHPTLTSFGFGIFRDRREGTKEECDQRFQAGRLKLLESVEQCSRAYEWLAPVDKIKTINQRHSSYGLKHWVERCYAPYYCSNGAFIAAALLAGFRVERDGPNACFNMAQKSLDERHALSHRRFYA
jgi:hypothetical protein